MTSSAALLEGIRRVGRAPAVLASVFVVTFLTALPFSLLTRQAMLNHLGNSMAAEQAARGFNAEWWSEFAAQDGSFAQTFTTTIIGFAAVLDNLSTLLDAESRPPAVLWIGAGYLIVWLFLSGGILDRYARARTTAIHEFFAACGVYFIRFLRLFPIAAAAYYVLFAYLHPLLLDTLFAELTRDVTVERTAFLWRVVLYALFGIAFALVNLLLDYAKVRAVVEDRRSMTGAVAAGFRFVRRHAAAVASLYLMGGALFIGVVLLYALVAPGATASGPWVWLGFAAGQLYLAARLWLRLVILASETALFQGRLAHAGYIATPPLPRSEPPIVERL
jgi:hypothetical protein